jgi:CO/xanthine dehydrogenase Mo-binding subunit
MAVHQPEQMSPDVSKAFAAPEYRVEGRLKVTGKARFAGDVIMPGMLWARFTRSPYAHAKIISIDTTAAKAVPGVHAVLTGADCDGATFGRRRMDWPVLAIDRVRFIGDRVAAIAAETEEAAEEAASLVEVEYEELPAVFTGVEALAEGAPILHPDWESHKYFGGKPFVPPHPNLQGYHLTTKGEKDIESVFSQAARVFEHTFELARVHQGYMEPHATAVWIDEAGVAHFVSTNKTPFVLRGQLAASFGIPDDKIAVDSQYIGGDFGGKGLSFDEFPCYYLAKATGRPIKAVMSYQDELTAGNPRHACTIKLRTGLDDNNNFLCHSAEVLFEGGAYASGKPMPNLVMTGALATMSVYHIPHTRFELKTAYTNTLPGGHMRSPGEPQGVFAGESHVDMMARELGIDPLEFRLRNVLKEGEPDPTGTLIEEPRGKELLEVARRETGWGQPLPPNVGRGIAMCARHVAGGKAIISFTLQPDGTIDALTGMVEQGAGAHTVLARVAGAAMSVNPDRIRVRYGDTATAAVDPGAGGGRVTHIIGRAAKDGATALKKTLEDLAAEALGWEADKVKLEGDRFTDGTDSLSFEEVAAKIGEAQAQGVYDSEAVKHESHPHNFSCYVVESYVDPETGLLDVRKVTLIADVGTVVNPVGHQGQLEGGFLMGYGAAVMEELSIEDGKVATPNLSEYKLPTTMDTPEFVTILVPTTIGPGAWGTKGAGELTNSAIAPAVANSVADAVGARVPQLPVTPERILAALGS